MDPRASHHEENGADSGGPGRAEAARDAVAAPFFLNDWKIEPSCNRVVRGDQGVQLEPRVMDVLVFLCVRAGEVVSRRDLVDGVWQAEVVADNSINRVVAELRNALGDDARSPRFIQTIPKRGYRVLAEVSLSAAEPGITMQTVPRPHTASAKRWRIAVLLAASVVLVVAGALSWGTLENHAERPRIVVLPFENLGVTEGPFFSAGICEEITSRLAALSGVTVISRTSAFNYDSSGKTAQQIARDLGVDYILEGTVRWDRCDDGCERVRVTPQLIHAADDSHVWAESYQRRLDEIFEVQTEIGEQIVRHMGIVLRDRERRDLTRSPSTNVAAYQAYLQGSSLLGSAHSNDYMQAVAHFERAVVLEPDFFLAHAMLALGHAFTVHFGYADPSVAGPAARAAIETAESIDPAHLEVRRARANVLYYIEHDFEGALTEFQALVSEYPNSSGSFAGLAFVLRRLGRWDESLVALQQAVLLDPVNASHLWNLGASLNLMRRFEEADAVLAEAIRLAPGMRVPHILRANNYLHWDGNTKRARRAVAECPGEFGLCRFGAAYRNEIFDGRYDAALELVRSWPEDEIQGVPTAVFECMCQTRLARPGESVEACADAAGRMHTMLDKDPHNVAIWMALSRVYAAMGRSEDALHCARRGVEESPHNRDGCIGVMTREELAITYTLVGEHEAAIGELEQLLQIPSPVSKNSLRLEPCWAPLRDHPRFRALVADRG